jgi:hypothetical protein
VENYFNYFTEIEEHYLKRRGGGLLLSTLDWALIETWKDAGIPLEAVLRGVDEAFDKYDRRPANTRRINSLAYCSQEVLGAAEDMKEAAVGVAGEKKASGFEAPEIVRFLQRCAERLDKARLPQGASVSPSAVAKETSASLQLLAAEVNHGKWPRLEDLERRLTVLEEKLFAVLLAATADEDLMRVRTEADRDLMPYRRKMTAAQIDQLHKQYVHKRLIEQYDLPRLSLFYM